MLYARPQNAEAYASAPARATSRIGITAVAKKCSDKRPSTPGGIETGARGDSVTLGSGGSVENIRFTNASVLGVDIVARNFLRARFRCATVVFSRQSPDCRNKR